MRDIVAFAIHSARCEAEIYRLEWRDNDPAHQTGLVRDAKHPTLLGHKPAPSPQ